VLVSGVDSDDPVGPRHHEFEVGVVQDGHELRVAWPPEHGVVSVAEPHHLKVEGVLSEVGRIPKGDR
jgi:hypothetical protein